MKQQFKLEKFKKKQQRQQRKQQQTATRTTSLKQQHQHFNTSHHNQRHRGHEGSSTLSGTTGESENLNNDIEDFRKDFHHQQQQHQQQQHQQHRQPKHQQHFDNRDDYMETGDDVGVYTTSHHSRGRGHDAGGHANVAIDKTDNEANAGNTNNEYDEGDGDADANEDEDADDYDDYDDRIRAEIYSSYPHYLHPPSWGLNNPLVLASHSPHTSEDDDVIIEIGGGGGGVTTHTSSNSKSQSPSSPSTTSSSVRSHAFPSSTIGPGVIILKHQQYNEADPRVPPTAIHFDDLEHSVDDVVVVVDTGGPRNHKIGGGISIGIGTIQTTGLSGGGSGGGTSHRNRNEHFDDDDDIHDMHRQTYYSHTNDDILYKKQQKQSFQSPPERPKPPSIFNGLPTTVATNTLTNSANGATTSFFPSADNRQHPKSYMYVSLCVFTLVGFYL